MRLPDFLPGLGRPVAFYPELVKLTGSVNSALLLCQLAYWSGKGRDPEGWVFKTQAAIESETGLTPRAQEFARRLLRDLGFIEEQRRGIPARLHFRLDVESVCRAWNAYGDRRAAGSQFGPKRGTCSAETGNSISPKRGNNTQRNVETTPSVTREQLPTLRCDNFSRNVGTTFDAALELSTENTYIDYNIDYNHRLPAEKPGDTIPLAGDSIPWGGAAKTHAVPGRVRVRIVTPDSEDSVEDDPWVEGYQVPVSGTGPSPEPKTDPLPGPKEAPEPEPQTDPSPEPKDASEQIPTTLAGWRQRIIEGKNKAATLVSFIQHNYPKQVDAWQAEGVNPFQAVSALVAKRNPRAFKGWLQAFEGVVKAIADEPVDVVSWALRVYSKNGHRWLEADTDGLNDLKGLTTTELAQG